MPGKDLGGCKIAYRYKKVFYFTLVSNLMLEKEKCPKLGNMVFDNRWQIFSKGNIRFGISSECRPIFSTRTDFLKK